MLFGTDLTSRIYESGGTGAGDRSQGGSKDALFVALKWCAPRCSVSVHAFCRIGAQTLLAPKVVSSPATLFLGARNGLSGKYMHTRERTRTHMVHLGSPECKEFLLLHRATSCI